MSHVDDCINTIKPLAIKYHDKILPSLIIVMSCFEGGYLKSELSLNAHNPFGIKWLSYKTPTKYKYKGAEWSKFDSYESAVKGFVDYIQSKPNLYSTVIDEKNFYKALDAIGNSPYCAGGYTADMRNAMIAIYNNNKLWEVDNMGNKKSVMLDPGHSSNLSPGADGIKNDGLLEEEYVLDIVLMTGKILADNGINVHYTRTTKNAESGSNGSQDLNNRCKKANNIGVDCYVSVHNNCADSKQANGLETLYNNRFAKSAQLANSIQQSLLAMGKFRDRGLKFRNDLCVLNQTQMPSALVEIGFVSNESDVDTLKSHKAEIASRLADGIMKYLGVEVDEVTSNQPVKINGNTIKIETVTKKVNGGDKNYVALRELAKHSNGHMIVGYADGVPTVTFK